MTVAFGIHGVTFRISGTFSFLRRNGRKRCSLAKHCTNFHKTYFFFLGTFVFFDIVAIGFNVLPLFVDDSAALAIGDLISNATLSFHAFTIGIYRSKLLKVTHSMRRETSGLKKKATANSAKKGTNET